ncbi:type-2 ice-structuring protein-like [Clinocottus analis]|uniref:type-2 ice-structuring protein-like n=1 Tax=Clinocottus analis TaxID=304258 RepID=UPI0035BF4802
MNTLTVSALVCAMMALTGAAVLTGEIAKKDLMVPAKSHVVKRSASCPGRWTSSNGRCFRYNPKPMTWARAEKNCVAMGGNLASVRDVEDYHAVQWVIMSSSHEYKEAWIGGSDAQEENQWLWSDGAPFHYTNWCPREPNNVHGKQNCLHMNHGAGKCWDDLQCSVRSPSVCAKKM